MNRLRNKQVGFTLIELMVTVGIVAILAALAVPAYVNYSTRAKVSEGLQLADSIKADVADAYQNNGGLNGVAALAAQNSVETGDACANDQIAPTKYVQCITVGPANGSIAVEYQSNGILGGNVDATHNLMILTPFEHKADGTAVALGSGVAGSTIDWVCTSQGTQTATSLFAGFVPGANLPQQYAPKNCT